MIYLLCGKAGSGKTTLAGKMACPCLSSDDMLIRLFGRYLGEAHGEVQRQCDDYLMELAAHMHGKGCDVVLDFGFWTRRSRREAREFFRSRGIPTALYYLCPGESVRRARLESRSRAIREGRLTGSFTISPEFQAVLDARFEPPEPEEVQLWIC